MASIKKQLVSGVAYTAVAKYAGVAVQLVVAGILGRLLSPDDFGTVAIVTVIISFFAIFCDIGIGPAVIQNKDLSKKEIDHIFSFTVWCGIVLALIFFCCSWPIASFYGDKILVSLCQILSLYLMFTAFNIVPNALFYKEKRFAFVAGRTLVVQVISGTLGIAAAYMGAGMYALLINPVVSAMAIFVINLIQYPQKFFFCFSLAPLRKIFSFSAYQFLFNIMNYFTRNLDKLLIGKYISPSMLGYYEKSYRLMMLPLQNIAFVISPVMHPIFSDLQHDLKQLGASYLKVVRFLAFIGFPLSAWLYFSATELMLLIFGDQWEMSIPPFRILSVTVGIQMLLSTTGAIFQAANSTRNLFLSGLLSAVLNVAGITIGVFYYGTIEAVAYGILITFTINFIQAYVLIFRFTLKQAMWPFWKQLVKPLSLTGLLSVVLYFVSYCTLGYNMILSLAVKGAVAAVLFVLFIQCTGEYNIWEKVKCFIKR